MRSETYGYYLGSPENVLGLGGYGWSDLYTGGTSSSPVGAVVFVPRANGLLTSNSGLVYERGYHSDICFRESGLQSS